MKHIEKCGGDNITTIKTLKKSHLHWEKHFHKNLLYFRTYEDLEADNEKDNSSIGNKTTKIYKQNPILNSYRMLSELEDAFQSGYHKSPLGYDKVDWFVNEDIKLENKMAFYFRKTKKDIIMTEEDEEVFRNNNICRFCEKNIESDNVRDNCHLTGKYRGPARSKCNIYVTQNRSNFIPFVFHNFSSFDCHMFFKKLVDEKKDKINFDNIPKTNEEYISVTNGCIRFIDSYRFQSSSLDSLVKTLVDNGNKTLKNLKNEIVDNDEILDIVNKIVEEDKTIKDLKRDYPDEIKNSEEALLNYMGENDHKILKTSFPDKWKYLTKKLAYPYDFFNSIEDYQKPVNNLRKEDFFSKLKNGYPDDKEIERTKEIIKLFNIKNGEELTQTYLKSDVLLLSCVLEMCFPNFRKTNKTFDLLGCSHSFFKYWIIHQLYVNMTLENYGSVWQIDHCLPIASFNILDEIDMKKCFNWVIRRAMYTNENISKEAKINYHFYLLQQIKSNYFTKLNV